MLRPGDVILCHDPFSVISFLISRVEGNYYSHVAIVLNNTHAIEALPQGVALTKLKKFKLDDPRYCKVVRIKPEFIRPDQVALAVYHARNMVGRKYDYLLLFKLLWAWATKTRHNTAYEGSRKRFICSEVVADAYYKAARFVFRPGVPPANTAPSDIDKSPYVETVRP